MPLRELAASVLTLIAVAGAGLVAIRLAKQAADAFFVWVLDGSNNCQVGAGDCFGRNITALIALTATSPIGTIELFLLGLLAVLMTYVQVALMVLRSAMLALLAGVLPETASFTNTQVGRQWFTKATGWTVAFVLYKPAAAIVYATAFRLTGANAFRADGTGLFQILAGLALMLIALVALPALMRFFVPAVAAIGGSTGGGGLLLAGAAAAGIGEVAMGAIRSNRTSSGSGRTPSSRPTGSVQAAGRRCSGRARRAWHRHGCRRPRLHLPAKDSPDAPPGHWRSRSSGLMRGQHRSRSTRRPSAAMTSDASRCRPSS